MLLTIIAIEAVVLAIEFGVILYLRWRTIPAWRRTAEHLAKAKAVAEQHANECDAIALDLLNRTQFRGGAE